MKLKEYFAKKLVDPVAFSVESGVSLSTIYRIMRGGTCFRSTANLIEKTSNGLVTLNDLKVKEGCFE